MRWAGSPRILGLFQGLGGPRPRCRPPEWYQRLRAGCVSGPHIHLCRHRVPECPVLSSVGPAAFRTPPESSPGSLAPAGRAGITWPLLLQGRVTETCACHTWSLLGGVCFCRSRREGKDRDFWGAGPGLLELVSSSLLAGQGWVGGCMRGPGGGPARARKGSAPLCLQHHGHRRGLPAPWASLGLDWGTAPRSLSSGEHLLA